MSKQTSLGLNILAPFAGLETWTGMVSRFATWKGLWVKATIALFFGIVTLHGAIAQTASSGGSGVATVEGHVSDAKHRAIESAKVWLQKDGSSDQVETRSNRQGGFSLAAGAPGTYTLTAEIAGLRSRALTVKVSSQQNHETYELVLEISNDKSSSPDVAAEPMEFADKPNFTVAGITDWTAVGGHGTDSSVHTSEVLTRETLRLKPTDPAQKASPASDQETAQKELTLRSALNEAPSNIEANLQLGQLYLSNGRYTEALPLLKTAYTIEPGHTGVEYYLAAAYQYSGNSLEAQAHIQKLLTPKANADIHRLAAEIDEKLNDPLAAVHEYELAVQLEPSEQNYFEWGSELLLHRAVAQAQEVLARGVAAYPRSSRMLSALGTALLASARYEEAAMRLCEASDLAPDAEEPYLFLGKIEVASPIPLACVESRLARFAQSHPENSLANYFYAMALWKRQDQSPDKQTQDIIESLLTKAVTLDDNCGDAYLQLGILYSAQHHLDKAVKYYATAIRVNPQLSEAHYRLGLAYDRLQQPDNAKHEFQMHDELEKQQADALERQRREIKQFRVVLQNQPENKSSD